MNIAKLSILMTLLASIAQAEITAPQVNLDCALNGMEFAITVKRDSKPIAWVSETVPGTLLYVSLNPKNEDLTIARADGDYQISATGPLGSRPVTLGGFPNENLQCKKAVHSNPASPSHLDVSLTRTDLRKLMRAINTINDGSSGGGKVTDPAQIFCALSNSDQHCEISRSPGNN